MLLSKAAVAPWRCSESGPEPFDPPLPLSRLLTIYFRQGGHGAIVILTGLFDESERLDGGEPVCVGGYLFKASGYKQFRRSWKRYVLRFRNRRFTHFHMTDLCAGHGEYEGLTISDRVEILDQAVRSGPRNLDSGLSEIPIVFQAAVPKLVASKYTTSGVRRPSEL